MLKTIQLDPETPALLLGGVCAWDGPWELANKIVQNSIQGAGLDFLPSQQYSGYRVQRGDKIKQWIEQENWGTKEVPEHFSQPAQPMKGKELTQPARENNAKVDSFS